MRPWHRVEPAKISPPTIESRQVFRVQVVLLFLTGTLLYFGLPGTRQWRVDAERANIYTVMRAWDGLSWYVWVAAAPVIMMLIHRFPLVRGRIRRSGLGLLLGSALLYLAVTHVRYLLHAVPDLIWGPADRRWLFDWETYTYNTYAMLPLDFLTYIGFFAISFSVDYYYRHRQRAEEATRLQLQTARLQSRLAHAELAALRSQLHPHFLFNSFNALATLVRQQRTVPAVEMIAQLSELLRMAIERTGLHEIPLRQELEFIRYYLDIERLRYGEKLLIDFDIEPAAEEALVPNIVLQPLVENAIKHAISLRTNPGWVRVRARQAGDRLQVYVIDDGPENPPPPREARKRPGIGLANSRAQLDTLYGADYRFEVMKRTEGGTTIHLDLPWRRVPVPEAAL